MRNSNVPVLRPAPELAWAGMMVFLSSMIDESTTSLIDLDPVYRAGYAVIFIICVTLSVRIALRASARYGQLTRMVLFYCGITILGSTWTSNIGSVVILLLGLVCFAVPIRAGSRGGTGITDGGSAGAPTPS